MPFVITGNTDEAIQFYNLKYRHKGYDLSGAIVTKVVRPPTDQKSRSGKLQLYHRGLCLVKVGDAVFVWNHFWNKYKVDDEFRDVDSGAVLFKHSYAPKLGLRNCYAPSGAPALRRLLFATGLDEDRAKENDGQYTPGDDDEPDNTNRHHALKGFASNILFALRELAAFPTNDQAWGELDVSAAPGVEEVVAAVRQGFSDGILGTEEGAHDEAWKRTESLLLRKFIQDWREHTDAAKEDFERLWQEVEQHRQELQRKAAAEVAAAEAAAAKAATSRRASTMTAITTRAQALAASARAEKPTTQGVAKDYSSATTPATGKRKAVKEKNSEKPGAKQAKREASDDVKDWDTVCAALSGQDAKHLFGVTWQLKDGYFECSAADMASATMGSATAGGPSFIPLPRNERHAVGVDAGGNGSWVVLRGRAWVGGSPQMLYLGLLEGTRQRGTKLVVSMVMQGSKGSSGGGSSKAPALFLHEELFDNMSCVGDEDLFVVSG